MWYLILSTPVAPPEQRAAQLNNHLAWMKTQHQAGNVLFSGPSADHTRGIYVIRAESHDAAQKITDTDPFHVEGLREYELIDWEVHQIMGAGPFSREEMQGHS
jgi:uncharacterized protein YciI